VERTTEEGSRAQWVALAVSKCAADAGASTTRARIDHGFYLHARYLSFRFDIKTLFRLMCQRAPGCEKMPLFPAHRPNPTTGKVYAMA